MSNFYREDDAAFALNSTYKADAVTLLPPRMTSGEAVTDLATKLKKRALSIREKIDWELPFVTPGSPTAIALIQFRQDLYDIRDYPGTPADVYTELTRIDNGVMAIVGYSLRFEVP